MRQLRRLARGGMEKAARTHSKICSIHSKFFFLEQSVIPRLLHHILFWDIFELETKYPQNYLIMLILYFHFLIIISYNKFKDIYCIDKIMYLMIFFFSLLDSVVILLIDLILHLSFYLLKHFRCKPGKSHMGGVFIYFDFRRRRFSL